MLDREHVLIINRQLDRIGNAVCIGAGQRDRRILSEAIAIGLPQRIARHQFAANDKAELSEMLCECALGREQPDRLAVFLDGLAVILEHKVIEARTDEVD